MSNQGDLSSLRDGEVELPKDSSSFRRVSEIYILEDDFSFSNFSVSSLFS